MIAAWIVLLLGGLVGGILVAVGATRAMGALAVALGRPMDQRALRRVLLTGDPDAPAPLLLRARLWAAANAAWPLAWLLAAMWLWSRM
ncbi:hypothetical protein JQC91_07510 [Jannaschia sp. Os4]|uniref:hypothetical protein n=1 Tax=Jannaschia sp. Os4 TaxID=2807617 RepID=UPI001939AD17|nr:hypothetical protein [Jannaschia sp. Os4]MBM2576149.1 hypothetical protein [Jannaschia sp. Os4]